jgi:hypothetical protein
MPSRQDSVVLRLAPELYGGNLSGLVDFLGFKGRPLGGDRWEVKTLEDVRRVAPDLVSTTTLADQSGRQPRYDLITAAQWGDVALNTAGVNELQDVLARLDERMASGEDLAAAIHRIQVQILAAPQSLLPTMIQDVDTELGKVTAASTGEKLFENRSVHLVRVSDTLLHRVKLPSIFFRIEQDPDLLKSPQVPDQGDDGSQLYFGSTADLSMSVVSMTMYLTPLIGSATPRFWSFHAGHPMTILIFSLGSRINGLRREPMEPLQLLPNNGRMDPTNQEPEFTTETCSAAIDWWIHRLNQMFFYLTNPATYADTDNNYAPHEQQHWMLTFDRIFRLLTASVAAARDTDTQLQLTISLLDVFADRVLGGGFEQLCKLSNAEKVRERVVSALPESTKALLLPPVERGITALKKVQDGFFIQRQRNDSMVLLRLPNGASHELAPESAAAKYLYILRNATHGFGSKPGDPKGEIDACLLTHHNGNLPDDLALLPFLYLLDVMSNPDRMRDRIARLVAGPPRNKRAAGPSRQEAPRACP